MLKTVIEKAGLAGQGLAPHRLPHTFATHLIRNGVDIRAVQELMGHSESETTAKYLHSDTRTKQAAVGSLDGLLGRSEAPQPDPSSEGPRITPAGEPEPPAIGLRPPGVG